MSADEIMELRLGIKDLAAQVIQSERNHAAALGEVREALASIRASMDQLAQSLIDLRADQRAFDKRLSIVEQRMAEVRGGGKAISDWLVPLVLVVLAAIQAYAVFGG